MLVVSVLYSWILGISVASVLQLLFNPIETLSLTSSKAKETLRLFSELFCIRGLHLIYDGIRWFILRRK